MEKNLTTSAGQKLRNSLSTFGALYSSAFISCLNVMTAMALDDGSGADYGEFDTFQSTIGKVIVDGANMLKSFIVPLAVVAALAAILIMYLPGMSSKTTDRCKSVIWACVATVVIAYALTGIFAIAKNIGESIDG